jgi:hypothetical protein
MKTYFRILFIFWFLGFSLLSLVCYLFKEYLLTNPGMFTRILKDIVLNPPLFAYIYLAGVKKWWGN